MKKFPNTYFSTSFHFKKIMAMSSQYKWWQLAFIFCFLSACQLIPVTIIAQNNNVMALENLLPSVAAEIKKGPFEDYLCAIDQGILDCAITPPQNMDTLYLFEEGGGDKMLGEQGSYRRANMKNAVIFRQQSFYILDESGIGFEVAYSLDSKLSENTVYTYLETNWNQQSQTTIKLLNMFSLAIAFLTNNAILFLGIAFFIYLTKFSGLNSIKSYRQSLAIVLSAMLIPTIITVFLQLFIASNLLIFVLPQALLVIMILLLYFKTKFRIEKKKPKA
ncbi:maltodextrose utilization protein MalA [Erysipelotrichaceae bacterium]|nr:maltodextrose utilization protein MalA [Erysipelotrichaceae bacterium]